MAERESGIARSAQHAVHVLPHAPHVINSFVAPALERITADADATQVLFITPDADTALAIADAARGLEDRLHQPRREHLYPRSMELVRRARSLGALGATISGAGPTVLVWCHYEATAGVVEALRREAEGWAQVMRVPFETQGADVREL